VAVDLADWRVIFATPGTPPKRVRGAQLAPDDERPGWLVFQDADGRPVFLVPSEVVLFAGRILPEPGYGDGETGAAQPGARLAALGTPPPKPSPAQVASAIRPQRLA
jgi:hypothetical protein